MDNFDFIKNKFDNDGVKAPDSISEEAIAEKLPAKVKLYQKPAFKKAVSLVACFALLIGILSFALPKAEKPFVSNGVDGSQINSAEIKAFDSYDEIKKYRDNIIRERETREYHSNPYFELYAGASDGAVSGISYSKTYSQVDGVEEADVIKNNGKNIFVIDDENEILIYEDTQIVGKIDEFKFSYDNDENPVDDADYICALYLKDNKLIVNTWKEYYKNKGYISSTSIYIYDVKDASSPELLYSFTQDGYYFDSRMIDSRLYVMSNNSSNYSEQNSDFHIVTKENGKKNIIPASSIMYCEDAADTSCIVISAIDIESAEQNSLTKAFFGCGANVYCNLDNLYITNNDWNGDTQIIKVGLYEEEIKFLAKATVNGFVNNQFAIDEKDGYLRIATTDESSNNLYILDDKLNKVGEITGFAKDESIKASKYIGDMCYLITYEETDPLFVIDVSNPTKPIIKGSVEITGFSSQLIPMDENTLLGIGYDDDERNLKLVLFDISNSLKPRVIDSYVFENIKSRAQWLYKVIVRIEEKNQIAIDYFSYNNESKECGVLLLGVKDNKICIANKFKTDLIDAYDYVSSIAYIGDTLYAFDSEGSIYSFEF